MYYCLYYSFQDRQMGAQTSVRHKLVKFSSLPLENLENTYYNRLYVQNRKSQPIFLKEIHSIAKRTSCLDYPWAQRLTSLLNHNQERLYQLYKHTLRKNTTRQTHQIGFLDSEFHALFDPCFTSRREKVGEEVKLEDLLSAVEEVKIYLMVKSWLSELAQVRVEKEKQRLSFSLTGNTSEEALMSRLLSMSESYFSVNSSLREKACLCRLEQLGYHQIMLLVKQLNKHRSLGHTLTIMELIDRGVKQEAAEEILEEIGILLGRARVLAHIFIAHQLCGATVPALWDYLLGQMGQTFAKSVSPSF